MTPRHQAFARQLVRWEGEWRDRTHNMGLSDMKVAELMGVEMTSFSKWKNGINVPTARMCDKIARAFGLDPKIVRAAAGRDVTTPITGFGPLLDQARRESAAWPDRNRLILALEKANAFDFIQSAYGRFLERNLDNQALDTYERAAIVADMVDAYERSGNAIPTDKLPVVQQNHEGQ